MNSTGFGYPADGDPRLIECCLTDRLVIHVYLLILSGSLQVLVVQPGLVVAT